jgi:hypothetical protein
MPSVQTIGLSHSNSDGNASVVVSGGSSVISRLRSSGSNTVLLTATGSGGTITSKVTDGTEDA